jgi:hypothetical protein
MIDISTHIDSFLGQVYLSQRWHLHLNHGSKPRVKSLVKTDVIKDHRLEPKHLGRTKCGFPVDHFTKDEIDAPKVASSYMNLPLVLKTRIRSIHENKRLHSIHIRVS